LDARESSRDAQEGRRKKMAIELPETLVCSLQLGHALANHVYRMQGREPERSCAHRPRYIFANARRAVLPRKVVCKINPLIQRKHLDTETREEYWISGPRRDENDRLYKSNLPMEIDEEVPEE
jgi:hypothetical protein